MGYTTDVAIGVWVGNTGEANTIRPAGDGRHPGGRSDLARHDARDPQQPDFAALLVGPDGNPSPEEFPARRRLRGELCAVTGHQPGRGETAEDGWSRPGPDQDCGELDRVGARASWTSALEATRRAGCDWAGGAVNSINRYAAAAGVGGIR